MAAAIAAAARKRAEKLGIQNEEVDEGNVGKVNAPDLRNPYLSKVEKKGGDPPLSPRSRRLAEMNKDGGDAPPASGGVVAAPAAPPPPPVATSQPPPPPPAAVPPPPAGAAAPARTVNPNLQWSDSAPAELLACVSPFGPLQQHTDAVSVVRRWASSPAARSEIASSHQVFETLGRIAMGPHDAPRDSAIEVMGFVIEDEGNQAALLSSGAAFGPLQEMMAGSNSQAQMAGVQLFASLCERDTYGGGGGVQSHTSALESLAPVSSYGAGYGSGGGMMVGGGYSPGQNMGGDGIEDAEEALAKVIAAASMPGGGVSPAPSIIRPLASSPPTAPPAPPPPPTPPTPPPAPPSADITDVIPTFVSFPSPARLVPAKTTPPPTVEKPAVIAPAPPPAKQAPHVQSSEEPLGGGVCKCCIVM